MDDQQLDALIYPTWSNPPRLIGDLNTPGGDNNQLFSPSTGFPGDHRADGLHARRHAAGRAAVLRPAVERGDAPPPGLRVRAGDASSRPRRRAAAIDYALELVDGGAHVVCRSTIVPCEEDPDRQSRRDRRARHPRVPRDGPVAGRRLFGVRSRRAARPLRRRGVCRSVRARRATAICASIACIDAAKAIRRRRGASRATGSSPRTKRSPRRCSDAGLTFIGPTPDGDRDDGQQDRGASRGDRAPACRSCRAPRSRSDATVPDADIAAARGVDRLSAARQGGRRRRRQGHADRDRSAPICRGAVRAARSEAGAAFGDAVGLPRAAADAAAPHRGAAARRRARHRAAVRRARVLDPAAASEGRRGDAVARGVAGAARGDDVGGRGGRAGPSATPTPARSSSCSTRTAASISSR